MYSAERSGTSSFRSQAFALAGGLAVGMILLVVTAVGLEIAQDALVASGVRVVDRGDEWHPVSMAVLFVLPLLGGGAAFKHVCRARP